MVLYLREEDVAALLTMPALMDALEGAMVDGAGRAVNQARRRSPAGPVTLQVMSAAVPALGRLGLKAYTTGPGGARFHVLLWDDAGALLAIMQADKLGQMRTGAASGVATRHLARPGSRRIALIGTGWQARSQVAAVAAALPAVDEIRVWGRTPEHVAAFCQEMAAELPVAPTPAPGPEEAVRGTDVVITATSARDPLLGGAWLEPGMHLNIMGSNRAHARELDITAVARATRVVVDSREQAALESGDLLPAISAGLLQWGYVAELGEIVAGTAAGRMDPADITLFKSHGIALWDVAAADLAYRLALESGVGTRLDL